MTPHSIESSEIQIPLIYTAPLEYKCEINTSFCHHSSNPTGAFGTSNLSPYYTILQFGEGGGGRYTLLCSVPWSRLLRLPSRPHPK